MKLLHGLAVSDVLRVHALTYKYEHWGGFLLFGTKQFAVGCGWDAYVLRMLALWRPASATMPPKAFHCLRARNFAISDDLLALMLISLGNR